VGGVKLSQLMLVLLCKMLDTGGVGDGQIVYVYTFMA